jgi:hypothetical protein
MECKHSEDSCHSNLHTHACMFLDLASVGGRQYGDQNLNQVVFLRQVIHLLCSPQSPHLLIFQEVPVWSPQSGLWPSAHLTPQVYGFLPRFPCSSPTPSSSLSPAVCRHFSVMLFPRHSQPQETLVLLQRSGQC